MKTRIVVVKEVKRSPVDVNKNLLRVDKVLIEH